MYEPYDIIRALVCQLANKWDELRSEVKLVWKLRKAISNLTAPIEIIFEELLLEPLRKSNSAQHPIYIIIDADEHITQT